MVCSMNRSKRWISSFPRMLVRKPNGLTSGLQHSHQFKNVIRPRCSQLLYQDINLLRTGGMREFSKLNVSRKVRGWKANKLLHISYLCDGLFVIVDYVRMDHLIYDADCVRIFSSMFLIYYLTCCNDAHDPFFFCDASTIWM